MTTNYPGALDVKGTSLYGASTNRAETSLTSATASNSATFPVADTSKFPATDGLFWVDANLYSFAARSVSSGAGNLTGCALVSGTSLTHANGAVVTNRITSLHVENVVDAILALETKVGTTSGTATIRSITPGADFTINQNGVGVFRSIESGAVENTILLNSGNVKTAGYVESTTAGAAVRIGAVGPSSAAAVLLGTALDVNAYRVAGSSNKYLATDQAFLSNTAGNGFVVKDASNGHYYRLQTTAGSFSATDLGTTLP